MASQARLVGVFHTLAKQHADLTALVDQLARDPTRHDALWPRLEIAVRSHERGELATVYSALDRHRPLKVLVREHAEEVKQLDAMIAELEALLPESREWQRLFASFAACVRSHVREEEREIFPVAQDALGSARARALDAPFKAARQRAAASLRKTRPSRRAA